MDFPKVLEGLGIVVGSFNPAVGGVIKVVANVLDEFDDDVLEKEKGLNYVSSTLREIVDKEKFDKDKLLELADIVDNVSNVIDKNFKLIK